MCVGRTPTPLTMHEKAPLDLLARRAVHFGFFLPLSLSLSCCGGWPLRRRAFGRREVRFIRAGGATPVPQGGARAPHWAHVWVPGGKRAWDQSEAGEEGHGSFKVCLPAFRTQRAGASVRTHARTRLGREVGSGLFKGPFRSFVYTARACASGTRIGSPLLRPGIGVPLRTAPQAPSGAMFARRWHSGSRVPDLLSVRYVVIAVLRWVPPPYPTPLSLSLIRRCEVKVWCVEKSGGGGAGWGPSPRLRRARACLVGLGEKTIDR